MKYRIKREENQWINDIKIWNIYTELEYYDDEKNEGSGQFSWDLESWAPTKEEALKEVFHLVMEMETGVIDVEF